MTLNLNKAVMNLGQKDEFRCGFTYCCHTYEYKCADVTAKRNAVLSDRASRCA